MKFCDHIDSLRAHGDSLVRNPLLAFIEGEKNTAFINANFIETKNSFCPRVFRHMGALRLSRPCSFRTAIVANLFVLIGSPMALYAGARSPHKNSSQHTGCHQLSLVANMVCYLQAGPYLH